MSHQRPRKRTWREARYRHGGWPAAQRLAGGCGAYGLETHPGVLAAALLGVSGLASRVSLLHNPANAAYWAPPCPPYAWLRHREWVAQDAHQALAACDLQGFEPVSHVVPHCFMSVVLWRAGR